jgi:hypothetical protein
MRLPPARAARAPVKHARSARRAGNLSTSCETGPTDFE